MQKLLANLHESFMQMLVDDIGDVTITNDGATILKLLEVQHPAAKVQYGQKYCPTDLQPHFFSLLPCLKLAALHVHFALQILVELADMQDQEVGDGTTSVVIFAAELLQRANALVRQKIHPTSIIGGYRLAMREVCNSSQ